VAAVAGAKPDVIVHEMTSLRAANDLRRGDRAFALTNRLRTQGLENLLAAARQAGTARLVAHSFCGWPYERAGGTVKTEDDPLDRAPPGAVRRTLEAIRYLENTGTGSSEIEGIVLRYERSRPWDRPVRRADDRSASAPARAVDIGGADGWWSFLDIDDAAAATAIERGAAGVYNIVDDEPAPVREWLPALAAMLGAKPPRRCRNGWPGLPRASTS
jgi:nucleoside-diphosphate-sugar epimerase